MSDNATTIEPRVIEPDEIKSKLVHVVAAASQTPSLRGASLRQRLVQAGVLQRGAPRKGQTLAPRKRAQSERSGKREAHRAAATVREAIDKAFDRAQMTVIQGLDPSLVPLLGPMTQILRVMQTEAAERNIEQLITLVLPGNDPVAEERRDIEADNAAARIRFIETIPCHTNAELAQLAGHESKNASATGSRWKQEVRVFAVPFRRQDRFPAFQFRDGRPRPIIGEVLAALPPGLSPWQVAFWFVSSNPWLDGRIPSETLDDRIAVLEAARLEREAVIG